ncbi:DUF1127 domain-containing protein [Roseobacter sp. CCS2]|uniref:DUF1127 domain-containing protein n=1 Tax=Roseobacter sp. CCS2 TaxID=391593 RepID=UPI0000F3FCA3|nr:DUF1127 domain-containing protein [Roseobacter sp. CCS2]EBA10839.1 hypothetical protein RCCS2_00117 [Roseobacter sp. CCS2]
MSHALHTAQINVLNAQAKLPLVAGLAVKFAVAVTSWDTRRKTRRALMGLEPHLLNDIGLDRLSAQAEAAKPFWQD